MSALRVSRAENAHQASTLVSRSTPVAITVASGGIRNRSPSSTRERTLGSPVPSVKKLEKRDSDDGLDQRFRAAVLVSDQRNQVGTARQQLEPRGPRSRGPSRPLPSCARRMPAASHGRPCRTCCDPHMSIDIAAVEDAGRDVKAATILEVGATVAAQRPRIPRRIIVKTPGRAKVPRWLVGGPLVHPSFSSAVLPKLPMRSTTAGAIPRQAPSASVMLAGGLVIRAICRWPSRTTRSPEPFV